MVLQVLPWLTLWHSLKSPWVLPRVFVCFVGVFFFSGFYHGKSPSFTTTWGIFVCVQPRNKQIQEKYLVIRRDAQLGKKWVKTGESYRLKLYLRGIFSVGLFFLLSGCETYSTVGSHNLATDPSFYRSLRTTGGRGGGISPRIVIYKWSDMGKAHRNDRKSMGFTGYFFHPDRSGVVGPLLLTGDGSSGPTL